MSMHKKSYGDSKSAMIGERANSVLEYWLGESYKTDPKESTAAEKMQLWFKGGPDVDKEIKEKFTSDIEKAASGELDSWNTGYNGLAAVILMDQLTRNCFRGSARMYVLDSKAVAVAKAVHDDGSTKEFPPIHRLWLYMALMHTEIVADQELCVRRFKELLEEAQQIPGAEGVQNMLQQNVNYAQAHLDVVRKWGRFPHRNKILGREDTPEESQGLQDGTIPSF